MHERGTRATPENRGAEAAAAYRGERVEQPDAGRRRRPRRVLELEDYLLAGWVVGVEEVVRRSAGDPFQLMRDMTSGDTGSGWWALLQSLTPTSLAPALLMALLSALPFMLFVAGPRIAAGGALAWRPWVIRFALFYLSSWFGSHLSL